MNIKEAIHKTEVILMIIIAIFIIAVAIIFVMVITQKEKIEEKESEVEYVTQLENMMQEEEEEILRITLQKPTPQVSNEPVVEEPSQEPPPQEPTLGPLEPTYNGFTVAGKITIPKTGLDTPFLDAVSVDGMYQAPCVLYKTGELNVSGNTFIVGHNLRNGTLFSDNKNIEINDKIMITAMDGSSREYTVYDKFITTAEDTNYLKREIGELPEITLQCCTDDDENRLIILAR